MKILFLHPPWPGKGYGLRSQNRWPRKRGDKTNRYPILLCYTATLLKNNGYEVKYMDSVIQDYDELTTLAKINAINPDVIFIETATPTFYYDLQFVDKIKNFNSNIKIILAGSHVTFDPLTPFKRSKTDFIVKGEMDYTTLNLINALSGKKSFENIKGICYKNNGTIKNNPPAPLIKNLDQLPFPDRKLIPHQWYTEGHVKSKPFTFVMSSRGCPNHCTYCLWPNVYTNHIVRFRSVGNVVDELEWLIEKYNMKEVFFDDDTLNTSKERVIALCKEMVERKVNILWGCSARVDKVDKEMLSWMKRAGCRIICYGAESASQTTLDKVKKGITLEQIKNAVTMTKETKITTHVNFMLGFPWETKQDITNTIKFAINLNPDTVQFSLVFPHPGSELFYEAQKQGWFYDDVLNNLDKFDMTKGPVLKTCLPREEMVNLVSKAHAKFFLRPSYILKQLLEIRDINELKRKFRAGKSLLKGKIFFTGKNENCDSCS